MFDNDTIAAISTPLGVSGIGIVRLSGSDALKIAGRVFRHAKGKKINNLASHTIHYGHILNPENGELIDEVLLTVMRSPATYTKEDVVEINCHGGIIPLKDVLELCLKEGARLAEPGEFTKRAFLNGRIDLTQAEAVIDIIQAKTEKGLRVALDHLSGAFSEKLHIIREDLINLTAFIEAHIDFPEDDIGIPSSEWIMTKVQKILNEIELLIRSSEEGRILREGISTAIIGRPNVGKSSLLNALLMEDRAIVTDIPGTTRDIIEEFVSIDGIPLKIIDTAGIRKAKDQVEEEGIKRSLRTMDGADIIVLVLDSSETLKEDDITLLERVKDRQGIIILNKIDIPMKIEEEILMAKSQGMPIVRISATLRTGLNDLKKTITNLIFKGKTMHGDEPVVTKVRHKMALIKVKEDLMNFEKSINDGLSYEILALDLRDALDHIGEIIGITTTDEILNMIFSEFCIGK